MKLTLLKPAFVEEVPSQLEPGVLYVSMECATAIHLCACGCGAETVTPLSPTDWGLYYDGEDVSLHPSIGNWGLPCRSHYFIEGGKVVWAASMSQAAINRGRALDRSRKAAFYAQKFDMKAPIMETGLEVEEQVGALVDDVSKEGQTPKLSLGSRIRVWWSRHF